MIVNHVHGVANLNCDHPDCVAACYRYGKQWRLDRARGQLRTTPAERAAAHVRLLLDDHGWSMRAVAGAAGCSPTQVSRLARRVQPSITRTLEAKILAVDPRSMPEAPSQGCDTVFVFKRGAARRIQALLTMGWTHHVQSEASGVNTALLLSQSGRWITRAKHDAVAGMYRELVLRGPGPSKVTATRAKARGYRGPGEWDLIDTDPDPVDAEAEADEDEFIDDAAVERRLAGDHVPVTMPEQVEAMRRAVARGMTLNAFERTTGLSVRRIKTFLKQWGLEAVEAESA